MKSETTPAFDADYRRLNPEHRATFGGVLETEFSAAFSAACDGLAVDSSTRWPRSLRLRPVRGAAGVFEMTWSFAGLDGRGTFEPVTVDGGLGCRWGRMVVMLG